MKRRRWRSHGTSVVGDDGVGDWDDWVDDVDVDNWDDIWDDDEVEDWDDWDDEETGSGGTMQAWMRGEMGARCGEGDQEAWGSPYPRERARRAARHQCFRAQKETPEVARSWSTSRGFGEERGPRILRCIVWEVSARERMEEGESAWWNTRYCVISTERDSIETPAAADKYQSIVELS